MPVGGLLTRSTCRTPPRRARRASRRRCARRPRGSRGPARTCRTRACGGGAGGRPRSCSNSSATRAQVLVHGRRVVAAAARGEVVALDLVAIHGPQDRPPPAARAAVSGQPDGRPSASRTTRPSRSSPASTRSRRSPSTRERLAGQQRGDDPAAGPAVGVLEARGAAARGRAAGRRRRGRRSRRDRAGVAARGARAADRGAELHHRLVEAPPPGRRAAARRRARPAPPAPRATPSWRSSTRRTFVSTAATCAVPGERADGGGRVRADARQLGQVLRPATLGHPRRRGAAARAPAGCSRARSRPRARRARAPRPAPPRSGKRASQRS